MQHALANIMDRERRAEIECAKRGGDAQPYGPIGTGVRPASDSGFAFADWEAKQDALARLPQELEQIDARWQEVARVANDVVLQWPGYRVPSPSLDECTAFVSRFLPHSADHAEAARFVQGYLSECAAEAIVQTARGQVRCAGMG